MKYIIISNIFFILSIQMTTAQNPFVGTFRGILNGDKVVLTLQSNNTNVLTGDLKDSRQTYAVNAQNNGNQIVGTAKEPLFGITFQLDGKLNGTTLAMKMTTKILGIPQEMTVDFQKDVPNNTATTPQYRPANTPPQYNPQQASTSSNIDSRLVGMWEHQEIYSSGYGSNAMSGTTVSRMIFNADGTMTDGGSSSSISGSSYYGNTGMSEAKPIAGVKWYAQNGNIYLEVTENGKKETVLLGKYYIEGNRLLITGQNGVKKLFTRR